MSDSTGNKRNKSTRERFLEAFREAGNVREACEAAGIHRVTAYKWRYADPEFAAAWDQAREDAIDTLEQVAWKRAKDQSDYLLWKLLQSNRRALYGDKQQVDVTITRDDRIEAVMQALNCDRDEAERAIAEAERIVGTTH